MKCKICDVENPEDAKICVNCNNPLYTEEEETEQELEVQQEMQGELDVQKPVTVLFASIKGFDYSPDAGMDLIEEITAKKNKLDNELDRIVSKYGGVVDKIIRGFFMATFGTKVSHQNNSAYAVLAAIELVEAVKKYGGESHVGINSGPAWVGGIGTERADGEGFIDVTVMGNTVNLSARLKGEAADNQILASPDTYELTKHLFDYEALPPVSVKGISEPVPVFAVKGKTSDSEMLAAFKESEEERLKRLQESIPPYLKEKALANKSRIQGERKLVTMLYSDVSGFTAMSEKFKDNPSQMAEVMDLCHKALGNIIYKYEGRIDQIVGDELMAIFGAPITHEDDPERAVQAGLEMLEEIHGFSEDMGQKMGMPPLDVHIGVNTGLVSIGQISDDATRMDYTVVGEPVELAEKLEDISDRGQLVVGERTYRLTRALFDFNELEPVEVAGREVPIYEVVGVKDKPSRKRGDERLNKISPIGRDQQFRTLKRLTGKLIDEGEGHFVCMVGEAGLGKSRLKRELRAELGDYATWLEGACFGHTEKTAYSIFQAVIKSHLDIRDTDSDEEIREKLIQEMNEMCGSGEAPSPPDEIIPFIGNMLSVRFDGELGEKVKFLESDPEKLQRRTFVAVRDWLIAESQRHPVVLALDDLHWIDQVSLDLIVFLMNDLINYPILTLCLYRPERLDRCWAIGDAAKEKIADKQTRINLDKLSPELSRQLLHLLIDLKEDGNGDMSLQDVILEKVGGNPFYMEEILRSLMDDEVIVPQNPDDEANRTWILVKDVVDIRVPDTLEQVMRARIDRLDDEPKLVLLQSSTIGRAFEYEILNGVAVDEVEQVDDNLSKLVATDMVAVASDEPLEYIFGHIVTYTIAYGSIPGAKRREYHSRVGLTIEDLHAAHLERFYERLAEQFRESNNAEKAAVYLTKAGTKARKQFSNNDAITFYLQALEKLENLPPPSVPPVSLPCRRGRGRSGEVALQDEQIECHEGLGDIYGLIGEYDLAIEHYQKGLEKSEPPILRARFKRKIASIYNKRANWDTALDLYKEAQEEMEDKLDPVELAIIYNDMAQIYGNNRTEWAKAIEMSQEAIDLIKDAENYDVLAQIYKNMGGYKLRLGEIDAMSEYWNNALSLATRIGDKVSMGKIHNNFGMAMATSDLKKALSHYEQSLETKRQIGDIDGIATTLSNIGVAYLRHQEFSTAMDYFNQSLEIAEKTGALKTIANVHSYIAGIYSRSEDYQKALEHYQKSAEISQEIGYKLLIANGYGNMCFLYIEMEEFDKAMEIGLKALETAEESQVAQMIGHAHNNFGRIYHVKEQYDKSLEEFDKAIEIVEKANSTNDVADFNRYKGEMLIEKGDVEQAKESLTRSLDLYKQLDIQKYVEMVEDILNSL